MESDYLLHTSIFIIVGVLLIIVTRSRNMNINALDKLKIVTMDHRGNAMLAGLMLISAFVLIVDIYWILESQTSGRAEWQIRNIFETTKLNGGNYQTYLIGEFMLLGAIIYAAITEINNGKIIANEKNEIFVNLLRRDAKDSTDEEVAAPQPKSDAPATMEEVLAAMDLELKKATREAAELRTELDETRNRVVGLEVEVSEKDLEIRKITETKSDFSELLEEKDTSSKSLTLTDSVMVGDAIMGGMKIDKQIVNDPQAIARDASEAYRMGKSDQ